MHFLYNVALLLAIIPLVQASWVHLSDAQAGENVIFAFITGNIVDEIRGDQRGCNWRYDHCLRRMDYTVRNQEEDVQSRRIIYLYPLEQLYDRPDSRRVDELAGRNFQFTQWIHVMSMDGGSSNAASSKEEVLKIFAWVSQVLPPEFFDPERSLVFVEHTRGHNPRQHGYYRHYGSSSQKPSIYEDVVAKTFPEWRHSSILLRCRENSNDANFWRSIETLLDDREGVQFPPNGMVIPKMKRLELSSSPASAVRDRNPQLSFAIQDLPQEALVMLFFGKTTSGGRNKPTENPAFDLVRRMTKCSLSMPSNDNSRQGLSYCQSRDDESIYLIPVHEDQRQMQELINALEGKKAQVSGVFILNSNGEKNDDGYRTTLPYFYLFRNCFTTAKAGHVVYVNVDGNSDPEHLQLQYPSWDITAMSLRESYNNGIDVIYKHFHDLANDELTCSPRNIVLDDYIGAVSGASTPLSKARGQGITLVFGKTPERLVRFVNYVGKCTLKLSDIERESHEAEDGEVKLRVCGISETQQRYQYNQPRQANYQWNNDYYGNNYGNNYKKQYNPPRQQRNAWGNLFWRRRLTSTRSKHAYVPVLFPRKPEQRAPSYDTSSDEDYSQEEDQHLQVDRIAHALKQSNVHIQRIVVLADDIEHPLEALQLWKHINEWFPNCFRENDRQLFYLTMQSTRSSDSVFEDTYRAIRHEFPAFRVKRESSPTYKPIADLLERDSASREGKCLSKDVVAVNFENMLQPWQNGRDALKKHNPIAQRDLKNLPNDAQLILLHHRDHATLMHQINLLTRCDLQPETQRGLAACEYRMKSSREAKHRPPVVYLVPFNSILGNFEAQKQFYENFRKQKWSIQGFMYLEDASDTSSDIDQALEEIDDMFPQCFETKDKMLFYLVQKSSKAFLHKQKDLEKQFPRWKSSLEFTVMGSKMKKLSSSIEVAIKSRTPCRIDTMQNPKHRKDKQKTKREKKKDSKSRTKHEQHPHEDREDESEDDKDADQRRRPTRKRRNFDEEEDDDEDSREKKKDDSRDQEEARGHEKKQRQYDDQDDSYEQVQQPTKPAANNVDSKLPVPPEQPNAPKTQPPAKESLQPSQAKPSAPETDVAPEDNQTPTEKTPEEEEEEVDQEPDAPTEDEDVHPTEEEHEFDPDESPVDEGPDDDDAQDEKEEKGWFSWLTSKLNGSSTKEDPNVEDEKEGEGWWAKFTNSWVFTILKVLFYAGVITFSGCVICALL